MSFSPDITLDTQVYSLQAQRTNSSIRSDASQPLSEPNLLTISHENAKNGRRSSVVILDDTVVISPDGLNPTPDTIRLMLKLQFNPLGGRTDNEAVINALITQLSAFMADSTFVTKLLNQES